LFEAPLLCVDLVSVVLLEVAVVGVEGDGLSGGVGQFEGEQVRTQCHESIIMVKLIFNKLLLISRIDRQDS
jgi:hypothetical protein